MQKPSGGESMVRSVRPAWAAILAAAALFLAAFSTAVLNGLAQAAPPPPTAAQAAPFLGDWVTTVQMGATQSTSLVSVKNDGGKVTVTLTPEGQAPITNVAASMSGQSLVI